MANRPSFGRRVGTQRAADSAPPAATRPAALSRQQGDCADGPSPYAADFTQHDEELEHWKQARKQGRRFPWRQLSLMASLCFGVASFVLPASVNSNVQWLLYALMAASLYAGFRKRRADGAKS